MVHDQDSSETDTVATLPTRQRRPYADLDDIDTAARAAIRHARELRDYSAAVDPAASHFASESLGDLREAIAPPAGHTDPDSAKPRWMRVGFKAGRATETWLVQFFNRFATVRARRTRFVRAWVIGRVLMSIVVAGFVAAGLFVPAVALVTVRLGVSIATGSSWSFPAEDERTRAADRWELAGCIAGHLSDTIVLAGVGLWLATSGRVVWGAAVFGAMGALMLSTLVRVSVLQIGVRLNRLRIERVLRAGGMWLALVIGAVAQRDLGPDEVPVIAVVAAAPIYLFAVTEILRTYGRCVYGRWDPVTIGREVLWPPPAYPIPEELPMLSAVGDYEALGGRAARARSHPTMQRRPRLVR